MMSLAVIRISKKRTAVEKFLDPNLPYAILTKSDIPATMMIGIFMVLIAFVLPPGYRETEVLACDHKIITNR